jgi:hypothetical protein
LRLLVAARERKRKQHTDRCADASATTTKQTSDEPDRHSHIVSRTHFRLSQTN